MSLQKRGYIFENDTARAIYEESGHALLPIRAGYSGNQSLPMADVVIDDGYAVHAFELKKTSDDTSCVIHTDDIEQLLEFCRVYPRPTYPYAGVKFNRRQVIPVRMWAGEAGERTLEEVVEDAVTMCPVEAKRTRTGNLSVRKPSTDDWPSSSKGNDARAILDAIGWL